MTTTDTPQQDVWRSRITGHGDADPATLVPHPGNPRTHPPQQQDVLAGVLDQIGWIQQVVVNTRTGHMLDGHLRRELALQRHEPTVPVTYVDLSEDEELLALATFDPISTLAVIDENAMAFLIERAQQVVPDGTPVSEFLAQLAANSTPVRVNPDDDLVDGTEGLGLTSVQFEVVITVPNADEREQAVAALRDAGYQPEVRTVRAT